MACLFSVWCCRALRNRQCLPFKASDRSRSPSLAQNQSKKDDRSPAHEKSFASSKNKKHMFYLRFNFSELKNFPYKAASSRMSNNKHDRVCDICLRYRTAFVIDYSRYCLPPIQGKHLFLSGIKRKLFSLYEMRTTLFWPNNGY